MLLGVLQTLFIGISIHQQMQSLNHNDKIVELGKIVDDYFTERTPVSVLECHGHDTHRTSRRLHRHK